ncbi:hypothetical protein GCM10010468_74370 [Actinocorallia longicatena]|uniref:Uncharacterized protein n=1 Tax=Actinocorallia longicatena TaxID=111803 RepID=A0ABP6QSF4_9ACTN
MWDVFTRRILDTGRLPLFCFFVAFILTFLFTRLSVRLIRADRGWILRNVRAGDTHIHHAVFGIILMIVSGIAAFALDDDLTIPYAVAAGLFGTGAALVLDEFALILHLRDVYWSEEGRASVDAVFVAIGVTGLLLLGIRPALFDDVEATGRIRVLLYVLSLVLNLSLAVVCLLKGKIWTGLAGLFLPVLLYVGVLRLARPGSPWTRWFYEPGSRKVRRAVRREQRVRRPLIRAKIRLQELIAGRHGDRSQRKHRDDHERVSGGPRS